MFGYIPEFKDYYIKLLNLADFDSNSSGGKVDFKYHIHNSEELKILREKYDLEKIAGNGNELSQILNLMYWVSEKLQHGNVMPPLPCNALHILNLIDSETINVNCYAIATVLNEVFLSMGFRSRRVHCRPYDAYDMDSHVVTIVYSETLRKWLYLDASWGIYVKNSHGDLLSIDEFRHYLANNLEVRINGNEEVSSEFYIGYMAKNLFWFMSPLESKFNYEVVQKEKEYALLLPKFYEPLELRNESSGHYKVQVIRNQDYYWGIHE
ncbi:hypothetical protein [Lederbergia citrea]|uniref:hypothetical protein n=1 Tax=Lederbergia citrea TaxID=2833581 RepID=UPI001BCA4CFA|nr:hypothetical protein [Lederbergia citrea]MBS4203613.1 hypothetical protein [Lederbergia citrea]